MGADKLVTPEQGIKPEIRFESPPDEIEPPIQDREISENAIDALPTPPETEYSGETAKSSLIESIRRTRAGRTTAALMCSAAALGAGATAAGASERSAAADEPTATISKKEPLKAGQSSALNSELEASRTNIYIAGSKQSAKSFSRAVIVANHSTVAKAKIRNAREEGRCRNFTPNQAIKRGIYTQGYMGTGTGYEAENRFTTLCKVKIDGVTRFVRTQCQNLVKIAKPSPQKARNTTWVNNWKRAGFRVVSKARAKSVAECRTDNTYALAEGRGFGMAAARVKVKTIARAKGEGVKKLLTRIRGEAHGEARSNARTDATAKCRETETVTKQPKPQPKPPEEEKKEPNLPPITDITAPEHMFPSGTAEICERESDPDGPEDIVSRAFTKTRGNYISSIYSGDEPGEYCIQYRAPSTTGDTTVTSIVRDSQNNFDEDQATFPIVEDRF